MTRIKSKKKKKAKKKAAKSGFMNSIVAELQKTEWLSPKEVAKLSFTVVASMALMGIALYFLDILFQKLIGYIL